MPKDNVLVVSIAAVLVFAYACGSSAQPLDAPGPLASTEAGADDASADGATDTPADGGGTSDSPFSPVVVTVATKGGAPTAGALVVFHDAGGAVLGTATTGMDGKASRVVPSGGQVTVAVMGSSSRQLITFVGVKAGDALLATDSTRANDVLTTVTIPGSAPAGTTQVTVYGGSTCHGTTPAAAPVFTLTAQCQRSDLFPVLAIASGATSQPLGFSFKKGNTFAGTTATVANLPAWNPAVGSFALSTTNAPASGARAALSHVADGVLAYRDLAGALPTRQFPTFPGFADSLQAEAQVVVYDHVAFTAQVSVLAERLPAASTTATFDFSQRLPDITKAAVDQSNPARPKLSWTTSGSLANTDGGGAMLVWDVPLDSGTALGTWTFVIPPDATSIEAPELPAAAGAWLPNASTFGVPSIAFVEAASIAGYDDVRAHPGATLPILTPGYVWDGAVPVLASDGLVRTTWLILNGT